MFAMVKFHEKSDVTVYDLVFVLTVKIIRENSCQDVQNIVNGTKLLHDEKKNDKKSEESSESKSKIDKLSSKNDDKLSTDDSKNHSNGPDNPKPSNPSASFFGDLENLPLLERYLLDQHDQPVVTPEIIQGPLNDMQETIDMPYQYLIEREIEKSKSIELNKINNKIPDAKKVVFEKITIGNESQKNKKTETIVSFFDKKNDEKSSNDMDNTLKKVASPPRRLEDTSLVVEKIKKNIPSPLKIQSVTPAVENEIKSLNKSPGEVLPLKTKETTPLPRSRSHSIDPPPPTQRSANITDLVMEGLMFTIRQDKDSLTVVEQKTKLEPDEVLENSEKIETTEGAKCLVNSSLLNLENLITKIDKSSTKKFNNNNNNFKNNILPCSFFGQNISINNDNNYLNNSLENSMKLNEDVVELPSNKIKNLFSIDKINREEKSFSPSPMEIDDNSVIKNNNQEEKKEEEEEKEDVEMEEKEEEDEDIIPEVMRKDNSDALSILHDETNLLMDDFDFDDYTPASNLSPPSTPTFSSSGVNKTPRIVSNEIVSYDLSALRPVKSTESGQSPDDADETLDGPSLADNSLDSLDEENKSVNLDQENKLVTLDKEEKLESLDEKKELVDVKNFNEDEKSDETKLDNKNKSDNTSLILTRESSRRLSAKRKFSSINNENVEDKEIEIEMWKFLQDMQHGVRVVVNRLDLSDMSKRKKYIV